METPQQPENKQKEIVTSLKKDFEVYNKEAALLPTRLSTLLQQPVLFILQWLAFFCVLAFMFLLIFVAISGKDLSAGIAAKYFGVPTDQLSEQGLEGIKKLLSWMFLLMAALFAAFGFSIMWLRKMANKYNQANKLITKVIKETQTKTQYL